jgi:hypothetical protein
MSGDPAGVIPGVGVTTDTVELGPMSQFLTVVMFTLLVYI